jgi:signal transduction histidine kinase
MSAPHPRAYQALLRRTRWRISVRGALLVAGVLAVLSAGAYALARSVVYGQIQERLEEAAHHLGSDREDALQVGGYLIVRGTPAPSIPQAFHPHTDVDRRHFTFVRNTQFGTLAVLPGARTTTGLAVAAPVQDDIEALKAFLRALIGLTAAAGLVALPAGYLLAGQALRPLDDAVRARTEFVALASHRLRTPLSIIRTSTELARAGQGLSAPEAMDIAIQQTGHLETLAQRLSDLTRAELAPGPRLQASDLGAAATALAGGLGAQAAQAGVDLTVAATPGVEVAAPGGDVTDLLTAVTENALRFAPRGGHVALRVSVAGRYGVAEVEDDGPGIHPDDLPHVTRPFFQGRRVRGGSGLGLAIAKAITDRVGGRIEIASTPGLGTRVRLLLPLAPPRRRRPPAGTIA